MKKNNNEIRRVLLLFTLFIFCVLQSFAQSTVKGTVTDRENGEPLPGVNVIVQGTTTGTVTDIDGNYNVSVPSDGVLEFSYVGYLLQAISVSGQNEINIALNQDIKALDEVVVVGYGVMKRSDLTGAVASIKQEDIESNKSANVLQSLQGKIAGLDLTQNTGAAGSGVSINLRGNRSITADNSPLILVDGVEYSKSLQFNNIEYGKNLDINPSDIESIEVLKDASSTAIYGTRGANGVILITTKKGTKDKIRVSFSSYISFNQPTFVPKAMNAQQFIQKKVQSAVANSEKSAYNNIGASYDATTGEITGWDPGSGIKPWEIFGTMNTDSLKWQTSFMNLEGTTRPDTLPDYYLAHTDPEWRALVDSGVDLDYMDMLFNSSITENYELNISGGTDKTAVGLSLGMMKDRGLLRNDEMKRYNIRLRLDQDINDKFKVGGTLLLTHKNQDKRDQSVFSQALKTSPIGVFRDQSTGLINPYPDVVITNAQVNPLLDDVEGSYLNEVISDRIFGSTYLTYEFFKDFLFKSSFGVDLNYIKDGEYRGPESLTRIQGSEASTTMRHINNFSYTWENTLNYSKTIGIHNFSGLLGTSTITDQREYYSMIGIGQQVPVTKFYDWTSFEVEQVTSTSNFVAQQLVSFFGRINYKLKEQLLVQASLRADGSSVLSPGKKWGYFPSASLGYRISEINEVKNIDFISNLKVRGSWGISGSAAVDPYRTITGLSPFPIYYSLGSETFSSNFPYNLGNKDLTWETTETWDVGLDFGFFRNRINGLFDFYVANTSDLLYNNPLPLTSVYPQVLDNIASTKNTGFEVYINTINISKKDFEWSTDWNYSQNKNKIVSLNSGGDEEVYQNNRIRRVGEPVLAFYDYKYEGIFQVEDLKAEYAYIEKQLANGDSILPGNIPMINNNFLPGDLKIKDVNGDGNYDDDDKVVYDRSPKFTFGINNNFTYKNWRFSFMVYGRIGQTIQYDFYRSYAPANQVSENSSYVDAWTPDNTDALFPRYYSDQSSNMQIMNAITYVDGSFVKIKDITLSYSLPESVTDRISLENVQLYVTGKNLITFSKLDDYDPERGGSRNFPLAKQYVVGINVNF